MPVLLSRRSICEFECQKGFLTWYMDFWAMDSMGQKCVHIVKKMLKDLSLRHSKVTDPREEEEPAKKNKWSATEDEKRVGDPDSCMRKSFTVLTFLKLLTDLKAWEMRLDHYTEKTERQWCPCPESFQWTCSEEMPHWGELWRTWEEEMSK